MFVPPSVNVGWVVTGRGWVVRWMRGLLGWVRTHAHTHAHMWTNPRLFYSCALLSCAPTPPPSIYFQVAYCKAHRGHNTLQTRLKTAQRGQHLWWVGGWVVVQVGGGRSVGGWCLHRLPLPTAFTLVPICTRVWGWGGWVGDV